MIFSPVFVSDMLHITGPQIDTHVHVILNVNIYIQFVHRYLHKLLPYAKITLFFLLFKLPGGTQNIFNVVQLLMENEIIMRAPLCHHHAILEVL